jgi:CheY-like chemotaxis protein
MLVAESQSDARTMIEYVLESRIETRSVADVESFDLELRRMFYDIILIDTSIAATTSLAEYVEQIRTRYKDHHVPIVAVDNKNVPQREDELRALGFDAYIAKPFKKQYLISEVSQILFDSAFASPGTPEQAPHGQVGVRKSA